MSEYGKITQVIGPVVDVAFEGDLPEIYTALKISNSSISDQEWNLVVEVAQHLGEKTVRCVASSCASVTVSVNWLPWSSVSPRSRCERR